jgi:hypothetical protein
MVQFVSPGVSAGEPSEKENAMPKMSRPLIVILITLAAFLVANLGACEKKEAAKAPPAKTEETVAQGGPACPDTNGQAVLQFITRDNPYLQWQQWPGKEPFYAGREPHGALLTTYVSPLAYYAIEDKAGTIPDTAMIVKENYTPEKVLAAVTVMYKRQGYNPEGGDWFWLKYTPDGAIAAEGKVADCIACHGQSKENDWLLTGTIR